MKQLALATLAFCIACVLSACSSSNSANENNFAAAINTFFGTSSRCVVPRARQMFSPTGTGFPLQVRSDESQVALLKTMVKAGVLQVSHATEHGPAGAEAYDLYSLTAAYKGKIELDNARPMLWPGVSGLCIARARVVKVLDFTKLNDTQAAFASGGAETYEVKFSYENVPVAWSRIPAIAKYIQSNGGPDSGVIHADGDVGVTKTHNGWTVLAAGR